MNIALEKCADRIMISDGCWEWTGAHTGAGYGALSLGGKMKLAHRVVYELLNGPIPDNLTLDHLCRNRGCCRPEHLEPVSYRVNCLRGEGPGAINAKKDACPKGHSYSGLNSQGRRICHICKAEHEAKRRERLRRQP